MQAYSSTDKQVAGPLLGFPPEATMIGEYMVQKNLGSKPSRNTCWLFCLYKSCRYKYLYNVEGAHRGTRLFLCSFMGDKGGDVQFLESPSSFQVSYIHEAIYLCLTAYVV